MKVWWCETHELTGGSVRCYIGEAHPETAVLCEMVQMQLVTADARIVDAKSKVIEYRDGRWWIPGSAIRAARVIGRDLGYSYAIEEGLETLLVAFVDFLPDSESANV